MKPKGRHFTPLQEVRGAIVTASASLAGGTASSLRSGDSDYFLDLVEATFANNSTAAAQVELTNDGTTLRTIQVPAGSTLQVLFDTPLEQQTKNTPWQVDMEDVTGTTVNISARFIKR